MKRKTTFKETLKWSVYVFILAFFTFSKSSVNAQSTETLFGLNYWEYQYGTDLFKDYMPETSTWGVKFVRIGGNHLNNRKYGTNDKDYYVTAINNVKSMGAEPLVQLSIHLSATEAGQWYDYLNGTKNLGIKYWAIGNEPDPADDPSRAGNEWSDWFNDTYYDKENNMKYTQFRGSFRSIAKAIKAKDANSIIVGPDFRMWWGDYEATWKNPFNTYYADFLFAGSNPVGTDTYNGDPIIDIFVFHYYGTDTESEMQAKYADVQTLINNTNALRPANQPIKLAVGEFNTDGGTQPDTHKAGQLMAVMARKALVYNAVFFCPWSVSEGWNFKMIDNTTGKIYSTGQHWKLLSQNRQDNYMSGQINNSVGENIMQFGMQDNDGYTIMLMNATGTDYSASVKFSTTSGNYSTETGTIKFRFNATKDIDFGNIALNKRTTLLYTFDANGNMVKEYKYSDTDTNPIYTAHNTGNSGGSLTNNYYQIQNLSTSDYLRIRDADKLTEGGELVQYENPDLTWSSIQWSFEPASITGYYNIINKYSGYCLRPYNGGTADNTEIVQVNLTGKETWSTCMWAIEPSGDGYYRIKNKTAGKYLRPLNYQNGTDVNIVLYPYDATMSSIKWDLKAQGLKSAEIALAAKEDLTISKVSVYPNPAGSNIRIINGDAYDSAVIFDVSGKMMIQADFNKSKTISIESLSSGLYIIKLSGNTSLETIKFYKK